MGTTLYERTEEGGIKFTSHRMGQVRIPNYVYDIWLPIIGAKGIAVYGVYCRLEREGVVKAITQADLAKACRIGTNSLATVNEQLQECGFIKVTSPKGHKRLMHWTVEIEVCDPPVEVPAAIVEKYAHPQGYEALSTWLVAPEIPDSISGDTNQMLDEIPTGCSKIVSLGLHPLEVATLPLSRSSSKPSDVKERLVTAMGKFEQRQEEKPIDPAWEKIPVIQGRILTDFYRYSDLPVPQSGARRKQAMVAAERLYQEVGSAEEIGRRLRSLFERRKKGDEHLQFTINSLWSVLETTINWQDDGKDSHTLHVPGI